MRRAAVTALAAALLAGPAVLAFASGGLFAPAPPAPAVRPRGRPRPPPLVARGPGGPPAGPAVLAFASGGFFAPARLAAAIGAWAVLGLAVLVAEGPVVPRTGAARAALGGLAALTAWTALSAGWVPNPGPARATLELGLL